MEMIRRPLEMTEADNREMLLASEKRFRESGDEFGNRQQRRKHQRAMRKLRKHEKANADV